MQNTAHLCVRVLLSSSCEREQQHVCNQALNTQMRTANLAACQARDWKGIDQNEHAELLQAGPRCAAVGTACHLRKHALLSFRSNSTLGYLCYSNLALIMINVFPKQT